jgi:hypothetical protein
MLTVFQDVALCSLVEIDQNFRSTYCHNYQDGGSPDDAGSKYLWNVNQFLQEYTAQYPRRQSSSHSAVRTWILTMYIQFHVYQMAKS